MSMRRLLVVLAVTGSVVASTASPAGADRVRLRNGNTMVGDAVVLANGDVEVHSAMGVWTVPAARVECVIEEETLEELVARELRQRPEISADELVELGETARDEGSETLALRLFERALAREPDHEAAHRALGHARVGDRWLSRAELETSRSSVRRLEEAARLRIETLRAERDRVAAARLAEEARARALWAEQARVAERAATSRSGYGIPIGWVLGAVSPPLLDPFTGLPTTMAPPAGVGPPRGPSGQPPAVVTPPPGVALPPAASNHRGSFRRSGQGSW